MAPAAKATESAQKRKDLPAKAANRKLLAIRTTFLCLWLLFSGIIFLIAILTDINWTRPNLEDFMSQALHRNVKLGRLQWHFGFKGLTVQTSRLLVAEHSGEPFMMAGNCEIGFSFWPLLLGKGEIHHFDLQKPLFMAVRTGEHRWNFDDLLVSCPEVDFVDCHHGHVFVIDRKPVNLGNRFPDTELNDVEIKLHRAGHFVPALVHISFVLPTQKDEQPRLQFTGNLWGKDKEWWQRNCHFHFDCQYFSLQNWQALFAVVCADKKNSTLPNLVLSSFFNAEQTDKACKLGRIFVRGLLDVNGDADGVPNKKLAIDLKIKARDLVYISSDKKNVSLPEITSSSKLALENNYFKANKFTLRVPDDNLLLNCSAEIKGLNDQKRMQGEVVAVLGNMDKLNAFIPLTDRLFPGNVAMSDKSLPDGKLFFDWKFSKVNQNAHYSLEATIADSKISRVIRWLQAIGEAHNNTALAKALANLSPEHFEQQTLTQLCLSKQAKFAGTVLIQSEGGLTLKDCSLMDGPVVWKFSGKMDQSGRWTDLQLSNKDLQLAQLSKFDQIKGWLRLQSNCDIDMSGTAQVTAQLSEAAPSFNCEVVLNNANIHLSNPPLDLRQLNGTYSTESNELVLKNIRGNTASGTINIDARMPTNHHGPISFHLGAHSLALSELTAILQLFHMDTKFVNDWQLGGKLKELDLSINGSTNNPVMNLTAIPDDMIFALPDSQSIMHANSGKIIYSKDDLVLDKLSVGSPNSSFIISLSIKNPASAAKVEYLHLSITASELADLQQCFASRKMPAYFKNLINSTGGKCQIGGLKGKVSGVLEYGHHGDQHMHGFLDLDNVSLRYGQHKLPCRNLKGKVIFTGTDLICHGITGNIDSSTISLEGRLINYENKLAQWHSELSAQIAPSDLSEFVSLVIPAGQESAVKSQCKRPVTLKIKSHMAQSDFSHSFTLLADTDTALSFSYNNFNFQQPGNTKLVINGSCRKDEQQLLWHHLVFDFAGSQIIFKGSLHNNAGPVNVQALIPEFMQASILEQSFCPDIIAGTVNGQIKGSINMQGPINALQYSGKINLSDVSMPALYLTHITGDLALQPTASSAAQSSLQILLRLKELSLGLARLSHASGSIIYASSVYVLKDFAAQLAGGQLTATGKVDLTQKTSNLDLTIKSADLAELWPQITNSQIDMDGPLDCHFSLESAGANTSEIEQNLSGSGTIHVGHGSFNRTGQLHARLNQVNLIHQGIFGFNVNNLLQSVVPAKTSGFDSIDGSFGLNKEVLTIRRLLYDSNDLKFSAAGRINLALHSLELDVAGVMPRVSSSVIHGPLGQLSREITLQKFLDSLTMHKLDKLPSLPLIGGIGNKTDLFTCRIVAPYNQPKLISQSIQKSFQWLNYRQANAPAKHVQ